MKIIKGGEVHVSERPSLALCLGSAGEFNLWEFIKKGGS